jgi:phosphatidylglycerophosphate synthase
MRKEITIYNLSNFLSLLRAPLALIYFFSSTNWQVGVLVVAGLSDFLDGYIARNFGMTTRLGAYLDALMDKFFVFCVAGFLLYQSDISFLHFTFFISRDFFLALLALYLFIYANWREVEIRSAFLGKATTAFQLLALIWLTLGFALYPAVYYGFLLLGLGTTLEQFNLLKQKGELS